MIRIDTTRQTTMHRYEPSTPRFAFGLAASVMTAITLGAFVIMPALVEADAYEPVLLARPAIPVTTPPRADEEPPVDLVALHEAETASGPCMSSEPSP
jgi:hypothetical protein